MKYKDREGNVCGGENIQDRLLKHMYGSLAGRLLLKPLVQPSVSKLGGAFLSAPASKVLVAPFVKANGIDLSVCEKSEFDSYNDFFKRKLKKGAREICMEENAWISPCDGKLTVCPIDRDSRFLIKHTPYTVRELLRSRKLADRYAGGQAWIFRLSVEDYHRYCYVSDGVKSDNVHIPGVFHTVNPVANDVYPIYKENVREYSLLRTERFGTVLMMEVGALLVGQIENRHGRDYVRRGQEKGNFAFGGSTIVLLTQRGKVKADSDLVKNTARGYETAVRMGEKIGSACQSQQSGILKNKI